MKNVILNWQLANSFGWGILGLNIFCHWANDSDLRPIMGAPIINDAGNLCDPLRLQRIRPAIDFSNRFIAENKTTDGDMRNVDAILVDGLGNGFEHKKCFGRRNIGRCIFENTELSGATVALSCYDELLTASDWNARLIECATGRLAKVIHEGVDPSLFCPGPKSGLMNKDKFYVFSGGKVEFRKGHDLVVLAFSKFCQRRKDCVLVTAWHSPWPQFSAGFTGNLTTALEIDSNGMLDVRKWTSQNGIDPECFIDIGFIQNQMMPAVLREMDVCLQPSRAEACTNLPVKEAMACGVPVIAAANTGMYDLLNEENSIPLKTQRPVDGQYAASMQGWGESDIDEIVAALEFAYEDRERVRALGRRSRDWLIEHDRTWQAHARDLKSWLLST